MTHPLKLLTYCPVCGAQKFAPCNRKALMCAKCNFLLYINPAAAVAGIISGPGDETILLTIRKHAPGSGMLDLPGGFIDYNESAEQALRREIFEELNLEVTIEGFFSSFPNEYIYKNVTYNTLDLAFLCSCSSFDSIRPADDVADYIFMHPREIKEENIAFTSIKNIIAAYSQK